jgi:type I restriction enzyme S subunit
MTAPKLRFKEFSEDYNVSTSQEASIQIIDGDRGNNYPKSDDFYDNEYCLFLNAGNVTKSGFKFENTQFINKEKDALLRKGKLQKNDLVITTRGTVGNIAYFDESIPFENIRINSGMVIARSEVDVEPIYLNQFLKSDLFEKWLEKNVFGSAQPQLTVKLLNSISISYPSKEEQTKIASFLSAVDEKISQLTQKHQLLSQYKQGMMQKLFSQQIRFKADDGSEFGEWEERKLSDICLKIKDGTHFSPKTLEVGDYKYLTSKNVKNGYLDFSNLEFVNAEDHKKIYSSCDVKFGDVLLTKDGTIGQCCVNTLTEEFSLLSSVAFLRLKTQFNNYFLYHLLVSDFGQREINGVIAGQALKRITLTKINDFKFMFPCFEEQTKIANFLSAIDQKIDVVSEQLEQAKLWKKGLLQQMFV